MTRTQFWILTITSTLVGLLFLTEIYVNRQEVAAAREFRGMELLIKEGQQSETLWRNVAYRVYQLSAQDAALQDVLKRQQITIKPKAPAATPAPEPAQPPAPGTEPIPPQ